MLLLLSILKEKLRKFIWTSPNRFHNVFIAYKNAEADEVVQRCSVKKVLLKISQNSLENTCARVFF